MCEVCACADGVQRGPRDPAAHRGAVRGVAAVRRVRGALGRAAGRARGARGGARRRAARARRARAQRRARARPGPERRRASARRAGTVRTTALLCFFSSFALLKSYRNKTIQDFFVIHDCSHLNVSDRIFET